MKWRHWAILIILVLLNYIIFSTAFTQLARQRQPVARNTRTPMPTFENITPSPVAWLVLPTSTQVPDRAARTAKPQATAVAAVTAEPTAATPLTTTAALPTATQERPPQEGTPTATPVPSTATPKPVAEAETITHVVQRGETLSLIAKEYDVTVQAIMDINELEDPNKITTGQKLAIPVSGEGPTAAPETEATTATKPTATNTPKPKPKPPTATPTRKPPTPTAAAAGQQFTADLIWDPLVAPNCSGPAISKNSVIKDAAGNPVNGVLVEVNCYDNIVTSHPSGNPGEYEPGHYDFSFGQSVPQDWTCTARVVQIDGQAVTSSQAISIQFNTNNCNPHGNGHQVAILNWTKNW